MLSSEAATIMKSSKLFWRDWDFDEEKFKTTKAPPLLHKPLHLQRLD